MKNIFIVLNLLFLSFILPQQLIYADEEFEDVIIIFDDHIDDHMIEEFEVDVEKTFSSASAVSGKISEQALAELEKNPKVMIEVDHIVQVNSQSIEWGINQINAPKAWESSYTGKGIKVAVLDTGISNHSDLSLAGGVAITEYTSSYSDDNGHGTHVAGIIGAKNNDFGIIGVSPDVELYAVKVLDEKGKGRLSDVIAGVEWSIENNMDLINLSLGTPADSQLFNNAVDKAYNEGILVVAAAGNEGLADGSGDTVEFPAKYESAIAVSATDSTNTRGSFSATGPTVEIAAPGVSIRSTLGTNEYTTKSGTSMAAPHVTGVLALLMEAEPSYTAVQLREHLQQTSIDIGPAGRDPHFGYGLVQAPYSSHDNPSAPRRADDWVVYAEAIGGATSRLNEYLEAYEWYPNDKRFEEGIRKTSELLFNWAKQQHNNGNFNTAINRYERLLTISVLTDEFKQEVEEWLIKAQSGKREADVIYNLAKTESRASHKLQLYKEGYEFYPNDPRFEEGLNKSVESLLVWARGQHYKKNYNTAIDRYNRILEVTILNETMRSSVEKHLNYAQEKKVLPVTEQLLATAESQFQVSKIFESYLEGYRWFPDDKRFEEGLKRSTQMLFNWAKQQHNNGNFDTAITRYQRLLESPLLSGSLKEEVEKWHTNAQARRRDADVIYDLAETEPRASYKLQLFNEGYVSYPNDTRFEEGLVRSAEGLLVWTRRQHNMSNFNLAIDRYNTILGISILNDVTKESVNRHLEFAEAKKLLPTSKHFLLAAESSKQVSQIFAAYKEGYTLYPQDKRFVEGLHHSSEQLFNWAVQQHNNNNFSVAIDRYERILSAPIIKDSLKEQVQNKLDLAKQSKK
ncbi:S8 family peptidase [Bacillus sp. A116_S68]|nr:S8 family peptidase [Bacillus sp. A116_S68]